MSDEHSGHQSVPRQTESAEIEEESEKNEELDAQFDDPSSPADDNDNEAFAEDGHAAVLAILPRDDATFAQQTFGIEGYEKADPNELQEEQGYTQQSVENDLQSETQPLEYTDATMLDYADKDPEPKPEQQAQQASLGLSDHDDAMNTDIGPQETFENDSSSLFVPEKYSSSHSPAPVPQPPRRTTSSAPSTGSKLSMYDRIREMQKRAREKKMAFNRSTPSRVPEHVDQETYLSAVTTGIRPPPGAYPQPQIGQDERAHREALAEFQRQKQHYERLERENGGRLGFRHDIEWMKIRGAEQARLMKRQRELAEVHEGDEQDLFPPVQNHADEYEEDSDGAFKGEGSSRKRRRGEQTRKENRRVHFHDAEIRSMQVALDAAKDNPKKKKKGDTGDGDTQASQSTSKGRGSKSKSSRTPRTKAAGKGAKKPRKTAQDKRDIERATKQAASLFNANVFEQQAGMGGADQPTFRTRNKAEALKELIASIPVAEEKQARNDMNSLLKASKDFDGFGACKLANNGNWMVRGMKTSLKGYQVLGTAFMRRRENDIQEPRGGLMADQMGLGKTLMMLGELLYIWGFRHA